MRPTETNFIKFCWRRTKEKILTDKMCNTSKGALTGNSWWWLFQMKTSWNLTSDTNRTDHRARPPQAGGHRGGCLWKKKETVSTSVSKQASPPKVRQENILLHPGATKDEEPLQRWRSSEEENKRQKLISSNRQTDCGSLKRTGDKTTGWWKSLTSASMLFCLYVVMSRVQTHRDTTRYD